MSTIPKAIEEEANKLYPEYWGHSNGYDIDLNEEYRNIFIAGATFAASPCALCEGKEKEIAELKAEVNEYSANLRNAVDQSGKNLHGAYLELQAKEIEIEELKAENERLTLILKKIMDATEVKESNGVITITPKARS